MSEVTIRVSIDALVLGRVGLCYRESNGIHEEVHSSSRCELRQPHPHCVTRFKDSDVVRSLLGSIRLFVDMPAPVDVLTL
jgi:hypothetical protein